MGAKHIVLAGGGHSHSLILRRWAMNPQLRPKGLITLVNRHSTSIYSGMVPGLLAGIYCKKSVSIDLRRLAEISGVAFVIGEIQGVDLSLNQLLLKGRQPIWFTHLCLDVGSESPGNFIGSDHQNSQKLMPVKPLEPALEWIERQDKLSLLEPSLPLTVVGSGLAAVEVAVSLRYRWPKRLIFLQAYEGHLKEAFLKVLSDSSILIQPSSVPLNGLSLFCTGSKAPDWLSQSGLPVDASGRVLTTNSFCVIGNPSVMAVGDCAVIERAPRPPSGVWAVKAARPLAVNLERLTKEKPLLTWQPQRHALKLIGAQMKGDSSSAWLLWRGIVLGPHPLFWRLKKAIDQRFMARFAAIKAMGSGLFNKQQEIPCRGCAAKIPSKPLKAALRKACLTSLGSQPQDAVEIASEIRGFRVLQSIDGFPALVSDPWLNGRLTALHACSDILASGATVTSAQALITLPDVSTSLQEELLAQTLAGIKSALAPQGACLIGGHTVESRGDAPTPLSMGVEVGLCVNGRTLADHPPWRKGGLQIGDVLLLSRPIGTGVLFAAAMRGEISSEHYDEVVNQMSQSQHDLVEQLFSLQIENKGTPIVHACTDITGFGLLGHLGEVIEDSERSLKEDRAHRFSRVILYLDKLPIYPGAISLIQEGFFSTLTPDNRAFMSLLEPRADGTVAVETSLKGIRLGSLRHQALLELLVDPQTCGPLLVACAPSIANQLASQGCWFEIGKVSD